MKSILTILFSNATLTKLLIVTLAGGVLYGSYKWKDIRLWWVQRQAQSCEVKLSQKAERLGQCQAQLAQCNEVDPEAEMRLKELFIEADNVAPPKNAEELNEWLDSRFSY